MNKKHLTILGVGVLALVIVWFFFFKGKGNKPVVAAVPAKKNDAGASESSYDKNLMIPGSSNYSTGGKWCYDPKKGPYLCSEKFVEESNWQMGSGDTCHCKPSKTGSCPCNGTVKGEPVFA